jgi:hypothetical protein
MNETPDPQQRRQPEGEDDKEPMYNGIPYRLLDDYDGGSDEPREGTEEMLQQLLEGAPSEFRARALVWAKQRATLDAGAPPRHDDAVGQ